MKKRFAIFLALCLGTAHTTHSTILPAFQVSLMDRCKYTIATTLARAINMIIDMAARTLALQGDPIAAEIVMDIRRQRTTRHLFCEAGSLHITDMFNHLVSTLDVPEPVRWAIRGAIFQAIYQAMNIYSPKWF